MPELPDWFHAVAEYMLREGLPETIRLSRSQSLRAWSSGFSSAR